MQMTWTKCFHKNIGCNYKNYLARNNSSEDNKHKHNYSNTKTLGFYDADKPRAGNTFQDHTHSKIWTTQSSQQLRSEKGKIDWKASQQTYKVF